MPCHNPTATPTPERSLPRATTVLIIGAGQAGLAMSRCLTDRSIDHVVLDRGNVGQSWHTERWDSLRLLTPNWMTRLPGFQYSGSDPDGYMSAADVARFLRSYERSFAAPVVTDTEVQLVTRSDTGYSVITDRGHVRAQVVVIATGACSSPKIPAISDELPSCIDQLAPIHYRNPDQVADGGVLVVGASASGAQLADELQRAGRDVTIAVGDHVRLPRTYRGMDIHWWMDQLGTLDERYDQVDDLERGRRLPSLQLVGSPEQRNLDLNTLQEVGVRAVGRLVGVADGRAQFSGSFANMCASADLKQGRLLAAVDEHATAHGLDAEVGEIDRPAPTTVGTPPSVVPLTEFRTVIWATGFRPNYPWLDCSMLDERGAIRHDGGVMEPDGMYVLGLPFGRRRKSSFIDGVGPDAADLAAHLASFLDRTAASTVR